MMKNQSVNLEKICLEGIRWGTYFLLFTPLILHKSFFFPFVSPKTIYFRILVEIVFFFWLILAILNSKYRPRINFLTFSIFLFLALLTLSSILGVNFERSFFATFERMTGLLTLYHLGALFLVLSSTFKDRKDWEKIFTVSILVGVLLSLYILLGDQASTRGGGTIGNTSFMGAYLLFCIFLAVILFLFKTGTWRIFSGGSLLVMLPVLFTSTAQGAILSFLGGMFLLFLLGLLFWSKATKKLGFGLILGLVILAILIFTLQPDFIKEKISQALKRMKARLVVWEMGILAWKERPLFGWGAENFNIPFAKYFNPCLFLNECGGEVWFDRAHNIVLDTLIAGGLFLLFCYLLIFFWAIFLLFKVSLLIKEKRNLFLPLGMIALLAAYFAQNLLVFDMINTYLMFFVCLSFVNFLTQKEEIREEKRKNLPSLVLIILILGLIFVQYYFNLQPVRASHFTVKGMVVPLEKSIQYYQQAYQASPNARWEAPEQFIQRVSQALAQGERPETLQLGFLEAEKMMKKTIQKNPLDFRAFLFLGRHYNNFYQFSQDKKYLNLAKETLNQAILLSPQNQQGYWHLAQSHLFEKKHQEAIELLKRAVDLEPRLGQSHWYLAMAYRLSGNFKEALNSANRAKEEGYLWQHNVADLFKVIEIYQGLKDYSQALELFEQALRLSPKNPRLWLELAKNYIFLGETEEAKKAAQKALELDPKLLPQVQNLLLGTKGYPQP